MKWRLYATMIIGAGLLLTGCSSIKPVPLPPSAQIYNVKSFTIVALEAKDLSNLASNYFKFDVLGFYLPHIRTLYVPLTSHTNVWTGKRLPDMYILGHEVLHLKEVENGFHK